MSEAIAKINLNQEIEFRNKAGQRSRLWYNPKAKQLVVQALDKAPAESSIASLPMFCPHCTAVLNLKQKGQREQVCPHCGRQVDAP